ncbi:MAG: hypothetical protein LBP88_03945 [Treponema sp.]|jgi:Na+-driven multidrug efflux pump|nr:hypothetical protein [Treponema sp.]
MNDDNLFIKKLYTQCMFASMLALAGSNLGQTVSAIIAGQLLESRALSVMAMALPIGALFSMIGGLLGVGGMVLCAGAIGNGRFDECHRIFTVVYLLNLLAGAVLSFILLSFIDPVVRFLGADSGLFEETKRYVSILIAGGVFSMSFNPAYQLLRLDGRSAASIVIFFAQGVVTITLTLLFLVVFRWGLEAVALAAVAGAAVSGLGGAFLLFTGSKNFHFTRSVFNKIHRPDIPRIAGRIFMAGSPNAMESLCILVHSIVLNRLIARSFGILALSSFKLIHTFNAFALVFIFAVSGPVIQFAGVFGAEKDSKSIHQLLTQVFKWGILFTLGILALGEIFTSPLVSLFGMASPDALAAAIPAVRIFALSLVPSLINNILICVYLAENRILLTNVLMVSRLFLWIVIPALLLSSWIGVTGVWHSFWIAELFGLFTAVVLSMGYRRPHKHLSPLFLVDREAELTGVYKSFSVKNDLESITQSSAGITEFCELNNLGSTLTMSISLAIEEMLVLIRGQSLADDDGEATINVRVLIEETTVILRVRNGGKNINPVDYAKNSSGAEEAEVMGIKVLLAVARTIDYRNTFGINNTTILLERGDRPLHKEHTKKQSIEQLLNDDNLFIKKLYTQCMFASMLALAGSNLGQTASAIIAGQFLESRALSVMAMAMPIWALFSMIGGLLGLGGMVLCTRAIGNRRFDECHRIFTVVYLFNLLAGAVLSFILLSFIDPVVRFLGASSGFFEETKRYVSILIAGGVFSMSFYPAYNLLRLDGRSAASVAVFFAQGGVTIVLELVLLVVFRWGLEAVALAAVAGAAVSGLGGAFLLFTGSKNFHFTRSVFRKMYRPDIPRIMGRIFVAGSPSATGSLCILGYSIVLNRLIARSFGILALSSFKLIDSFRTIALVFILAVSGPVTQFVGVFGAEKDSKSIHQLLTQALKWGILFTLGYVVLGETFTPQMVSLFGITSPDTLAAAVLAVRIFALSLVPSLINNILICVYQAENRILLTNVLMVSRLFLWIVIPALLLSSWIGVTGVWHSFWIAESFCLFTAMVLSMGYRRSHKHLSPLFMVDREAELTGVYKSFSVKNDLESITQSSAGITEFCELNNLGSTLTMSISLAIEEMLVLIRAQSLADDDGEATINVRVLIEETTVILRVRNGGKNINPVDYAKNSSGAEEAKVMGIKVLLAVARTIDYRNTFGINNTTILLERREPILKRNT